MYNELRRVQVLASLYIQNSVPKLFVLRHASTSVLITSACAICDWYSCLLNAA